MLRHNTLLEDVQGDKFARGFRQLSFCGDLQHPKDRLM